MLHKVCLSQRKLARQFFIGSEYLQSGINITKRICYNSFADPYLVFNKPIFSVFTEPE